MASISEAPEWKCVVKLIDRASDSSKIHNYKVQCIFCEKQYSGSSTRIRAHVLGIAGIGVAPCRNTSAIPPELYEEIQSNETKSKQLKFAQEKKRKLTDLKRTQYMDLLQQGTDKQRCDEALARFFFAEGVAFRKVESHLFKEMIQQISKLPSYRPPCRDTLSGTLLDREFNRMEIEVREAISKEEALTILADGWKNSAGCPITSFIVATVDKKWYLKSFQTSGQRKTG